MDEMNKSSKFSLQLLSMPGLCKKLKLNEEITERITGSKDLGYNPSVLVGNWAEEQTPYLHQTHIHLPLYNTDYSAPSRQYDVKSIWDMRIRSQGLPLLMLREHGRLGEFRDNMATVYDLAYRCKARDYLEANYANVTGYGLKEMKKEVWERQIASRRRIYVTESKDSFVPYGDNIYLAQKKSVVPRQKISRSSSPSRKKRRKKTN